MRLRSARGKLIYVLFIVLLLCVDRLTKTWAIVKLAPLSGSALPVLDGILRLRFVLNSGAAFSILRSKPILVTILSIIVLLPLCAMLLYSRASRASTLYCVSLVLAGGLGNLWDRLRWGAVVDFIELTFIAFPVFNFADMCVTAGAIGFACALFLSGGRKREYDVSG